MERKKVLLGNGDILFIDGICEDDENFYSCTYLSPKTGTEIPKIRVPVRSCIESDKDDIDLECVPKKEKESKEYTELASLGFGVDYSNVNIWVHIKKIGLVKLTKTTKKSVHFIDSKGNNRYTAVKNVKSIYNYSPGTELPTVESQKKRKRKSNSPKSKKSTNNKVGANKPVKSGDISYIDEVPEEIDYRDRQVFIDINENKKGLRVKNVCKGKIFWKNLETGKCSAILRKKVNDNNNIVIYEYK